MATYAVGDIQGCWESFQRLLDLCGFDPSADRLWLAGDLVNRGPRSLEVLRYVKALGPVATCVLGNHELHLLARAEGSRAAKPRDSFEELLAAPDRDELLSWLRALPFVHLAEGFLLVHAGLLPSWSAEMALALSREASGRLVSEGQAQIREVSARSLSWSEGLSDLSRAAVAINAFTVLRCCTAQGEMILEYSGPPDLAPPGAIPWHLCPGRQSESVTVVCGHWAAQGQVLRPDLIALDTGCVWGDALTAVRLEDRQVFRQVAVERG